MDFTIVPGLLAVLLAAIPIVAAYFGRETRRTRKQNRQLRTLNQEFDLWVFELERRGWTSRGLRPPERPELLRAVHADADDDSDAGQPAGPPQRGPDDEAPRRARHAAP